MWDKKMKLYFAPMNNYSNYLYRHLLLKNGADYVFSELIMIDKFKEYKNNKLRVFPEDINKTIFQIGTGTKEGIVEGVNILKNVGVKEVNLNMGCPHSTFKEKKICAGLLYYKDLMKELCDCLRVECEKYNIIPSVKLRIGLSKENIEINNYLNIIRDCGIKKVYVHARSLCHNYSEKASHHLLDDLKKVFDDLEIIINGDVDCYNNFLAVKKDFDGVMIGRSALINPFIFSDIKNCVSTKKNEVFCPELHDLSLDVKENIVMKQEKKHFIRELVNLAIKENNIAKVDVSIIKHSLNQLFKGVTNSGIVLEKINKTKTLEEIKELMVEI